jgi:hypothetical protein
MLFVYLLLNKDGKLFEIETLKKDIGLKLKIQNKF